MVLFKSASVYFAATFLAAQSVVAEEAHALEVFPELKGNGPIDIAYVNPDTHKAIHEKVDENGQGSVQKRSYPVNQDALTKILKNHNGNGFCKGFCPGYSPKPVTKTSLKTSTKVVQVTTTITPPKTTTTRTATAKAPADSTVTQTATSSTTTTTTFTADTSTITSSAVITEVATQTIVTTETITLSFPTTLAAPAPPSPRGLNPPSWLKGFATHLICPACQKVWPKPSPKTVSICKTTTKTTTQTRTATKPRSTATSTITITPTAKTVTVSVATTLTFTDSTTSTPLATTTFLSTTQTTTTLVSTITRTDCPQQTAGVSGIGTNQPGSLRFPAAQSPSECCIACFNSLGCNHWAYLGQNFCAYSVAGPPNVNPDAQCPNGKGDTFFFRGSEAQNPGSAGGPGQCANSPASWEG